MTTYSRKNLSLDLSKFTALSPQPGDSFEYCNFSQAVPKTKISDAYTGLTFSHCNLVNIDPPADATIIDCNTTQISRCAHLHPNWGLDAEDEDCPHVTDSDTINYDGTLVKTFYHYADQKYSSSSSSSSSSGA